MSSRWYIVHVLSGFEKKVAATIKEQATKKNLMQYFENIVVPVENVIEVKRGKKVTTEHKLFPGYVLIKMDLNDQSWPLVNNIRQVTGFLGANSKPQPISDREAQTILKQIEEGAVATKHSVSFEIGESVKVIDGPFESFIGVVEEVDNDKNRLKVAVTIFGRSTPVELEFSQVSKL